jgi:hypothetical protein
MSTKDKLLRKLHDSPHNFAWDDLVSLMKKLGYRQVKSGRTGGSRRRFVHKTYAPISIHEPHPQSILKKYQVDLIVEALEREGIS